MKENSEEDIKNIEEIIELSKKEIDAKDENMTAILDIEDLISLKHILLDYKRVLEINKVLLKENEILKEEKEQAWEEWNNLERGSYETEQKLKQQIKELQKENEELKNKIMEKDLEIIGKEEYTKANMGEIIEKYYTANEDCVTKQKIKDKIEELKEEKDGSLLSVYNVEINYCIRALQELLEEEGDNK